MAKKLINAYTQLDLNLPENQSKLENLENGELVVQSSKGDELKIWGRTADGSVASVPTTQDVTDIVDEKVSDIKISINMDGYARIDKLSTINGQPIYNENGPTNIVISGGEGGDVVIPENVATLDDVQGVQDSLDAYKGEVTTSLGNKVETSDFEAYKEEVTNALDVKVNGYSKSEVDTLLLSKSDVGVSFTKEETTKFLNKKANSTEVYTKEEVNNLVSTLPTFKVEVVENLPTENISETTMYLVPTGESSEDGSLYTTYLYSNGDWKILGTQSLNLNNYDTSSKVDTKIAAALNIASSNAETLLATELSDVLRVGTGVTSNDFNTFKGEVYTKEEVDEIVENLPSSPVDESVLEKYVKKTGLKTINGNSLLLTGEEGESTDILIIGGGGDVDVETLKNTFVEKTIYEGKIKEIESELDSIEEDVDRKVEKSIYEAKIKAVDNTLAQKADTTYVTNYVQATLAEKESYGMVVIPETVYEKLIINGEVYWNDVLLTYNENNIYLLYDETEEQEELPTVNIPDFSAPEVTLLSNYKPSEAIVITGVTVLNLNGKQITAPLHGLNGEVVETESDATDSYGLLVKEGGDITINGEGVIEAQPTTYSMAVWAQGGKVTINGGTFKNGGDGCDLIYASAGGQVEIYGGEFIATEYVGNEPGTTNPHCALNIKNSDRDNSDIKVYGGRFYKFDPANNLSEPNPSTSWLEKHPNGFVAEGYKSVQDGDWFEVIPE